MPGGSDVGCANLTTKTENEWSYTSSLSYALMTSTGTTSPTAWGSCVHPHIYSLVHMCTNILTEHSYKWLLLLHEMFSDREVLCAKYNKVQNVKHCGYI